MLTLFPFRYFLNGASSPVIAVVSVIFSVVMFLLFLAVKGGEPISITVNQERAMEEFLNRVNTLERWDE